MKKDNPIREDNTLINRLDLRQNPFKAKTLPLYSTPIVQAFDG